MPELCRMCLKSSNLIWIFSEEHKSMQEIIKVTTSVEISETDTVSQKVCRKCVAITKQMFKFRQTAVQNDLFLKKKEQNENAKAAETSTCIHSSVVEIFSNYKNIKLPPVALNMHLLPVIDLHRLEPSIVSQVLKKRDEAHKEQIELLLQKSRLSLKLHRKRKSDEVSTIPAKLQFFESVGMRPVSSDNEYEVRPEIASIPESLNESQDIIAMVTNSVEILICEYCNATCATKRVLQGHIKRNHSKCQFCKRSFQTVAKKTEHIKNCSAKPEIKSLVIELPKIEFNSQIREKYPDSFVSFAPLKKSLNAQTSAQSKTAAFSEVTLSELIKEFLSEDSESKSTQPKPPAAPSQSSQLSFSTLQTISPRVAPPTEVVSKTLQEQAMSTSMQDIVQKILACRRESEALPSTSNSSNSSSTMDPKKIQQFKDSIVNSSTKADFTKPKQKDFGDLSLNAKLKSISKPKPRSAILIDTPTNRSTQEIVPVIVKPSVKSNVKIYDTSSVSAVRAEIKIKGNDLLDHIDTKLNDIDIIKYLLMNSEKKKYHVDQCVQTTPPPTTIKMNIKDKICYFHNLKHKLHSFIPVDIQTGSFSITFSEKSKLQNNKKNKPWRTWVNLKKQTIAKTDRSLLQVYNLQPAAQPNPSPSGVSSPGINGMGVVINQAFQQNHPESSGFQNICNIGSAQQPQYNLVYSHPTGQMQPTLQFMLAEETVPPSVTPSQPVLQLQTTQHFSFGPVVGPVVPKPNHQSLVNIPFRRPEYYNVISNSTQSASSSNSYQSRSPMLRVKNITELQ